MFWFCYSYSDRRGLPVLTNSFPPRPSSDREFGDLGPRLQLAGLTGGGSGRIALTLNEAGTAAPFTVDAELSSLRFAPSAGAAPITADRVTMTVEGQDPGFSQPGRVDIAATADRKSTL